MMDLEHIVQTFTRNTLVEVAQGRLKHVSVEDVKLTLPITISKSITRRLT